METEGLSGEEVRARNVSLTCLKSHTATWRLLHVRKTFQEEYAGEIQHLQEISIENVAGPGQRLPGCHTGSRASESC
jgi:hypothetical protein